MSWALARGKALGLTLVIAEVWKDGFESDGSSRVHCRRGGTGWLALDEEEISPTRDLHFPNPENQSCKAHPDGGNNFEIPI